MLKRFLLCTLAVFLALPLSTAWAYVVEPCQDLQPNRMIVLAHRKQIRDRLELFQKLHSLRGRFCQSAAHNGQFLWIAPLLEGDRRSQLLAELRLAKFVPVDSETR